MNASSNSGSALAQSIPVYRAEEFLVIDGANIDDTLSFAAEVMLDDVYELAISPNAAACPCLPNPTAPTQSRKIPKWAHLLHVSSLIVASL